MPKPLGKNRQVVEEGNTGSSTTNKQGYRKTFYTFTLFNYNDIVKEELNRQLQSICKKYIYGDEICPSTKKEHLQGFFALKKPMRITEIKLINNPKLIPCNGNEEQNVKYCSKDGIVTKWGFPKPIKIIENLRPWQAEIEQICLSEPDDRTIHWYWETDGNIGKSAFIKYMIVTHKALLCQGGKHSDIINLVFNTDMDRSNIVLFDIPRANKGNISYSALECIKNGMVCNTKYETGVKVFNSPHIIIFANFPPENPELLSNDRWIIKELLV